MTLHDSAFGQATRRGLNSQRRAMTGTDLAAVLVCCLLAAAVLYLTFGRGPISRELAPKTVCAANLSGMAKSMHTYAYENKDVWPVISFDMSNEPEQGSGYIEYVNAIRADLSQSPDSLPTRASTTACLWLLVREGMSAPKSFYCPVSNDEPLEVDDPLTMTPDAPEIARNDFDSYENCSYGYQIPFGKVGRPHGGLDPRMPLAADKGPFGAALEAGAKDPGMPTPGVLDPVEKWRPWNSPNHKGEGQNVLFNDSHVEWVDNPIVGIDNDNIYTGWANPARYVAGDFTWRIHGRPPTSKEAPWSDRDTFIYP